MYSSLFLDFFWRKEAYREWQAFNWFLSVACVSHESYLACTLDSCCELTLMTSTGTCNSAGKDLCSVGCELAKLLNILVIDFFNLIHTECANLLA